MKSFASFKPLKTRRIPYRSLHRTLGLLVLSLLTITAEAKTELEHWSDLIQKQLAPTQSTNTTDQIKFLRGELKRLTNNKNCYFDEKTFVGCVAILNELSARQESKQGNVSTILTVTDGQPSSQPTNIDSYNKTRSQILKQWQKSLKENLALSSKPINFEEQYGKSEKTNLQFADYIITLKKYMTWRFDGHSTLLPTTYLNERLSGNSQKFLGIGVKFSKLKNGHFVFKEIQKSGPANNIIIPGDQLLKIKCSPQEEFKDVIPLSVSQLSTCFRSLNPIPVQLKVLRDQKSLILPAIQRAKVTFDNLSLNRVSDSHAVLKVSYFTKNLAREVEVLLEELPNKDSLKGLVIDLRGNSGGVLQSAKKLASLFLPPNKVFTTIKNRHFPHLLTQISSHRMVTEELGKSFTQNIPLVLIIDEKSASATEAIAGAFKAYERALIVGTKSSGKGSYQLPIEHGKLSQTVSPAIADSIPFANLRRDFRLSYVLTAALFYQPSANGKKSYSNQVIGITPHFIRHSAPAPINQTADSHKDKDDQFPTTQRQIDLVENLAQGSGKEPSYEVSSDLSQCVNKQTSAREKYERTQNKYLVDYQLDSALEVLSCIDKTGQ